jgi:hypothetical protein
MNILLRGYVANRRTSGENSDQVEVEGKQLPELSASIHHATTLTTEVTAS